MERKSFVTVLPSLGLPYEGRIPQGKVELFPIRTVDWKHFVGGNLTNLGEAFNGLVKSCMKTNFPVQDLTLTDRQFILLQLRISSFGEMKKVTSRCSCGGIIDESVNLESDLRIEHLNEETFEEPFDVTLPRSKEVVSLKFLRVSDETKVDALAKQSRRSRSVQSGENVTMIPYMAARIVAVDGKELDTQELYSWIENTLAGDTIFINKELANRDSGVFPEVFLKCNACGNDVEVSLLTPDNNFLFPD